MAKKVAAAGPVERPWALPDGWRWERLRSIGRWGSGGTPKAKSPDYYGGGIPWYKIGDLTDGVLRGSADTITQAGLGASSAKWVPAGALLIAMYGSIGKLGLTTEPVTTNQAIAFCVPDVSIVELKYLFYFLLFRRRHLLSLGQGGTQQNISQTILLDEPIALPEPETQARIVARIDELFAEIDDAEASLARARDDLTTWRRALLKAAVIGELTADWRAAIVPVAENVGSFPASWGIKPIGAVTTSLDHKRRPVNKKERQDRIGPIPYYGANGPVGFIDGFIFDEPLVLVVEDETFAGRIKDFSYIIRGKAWVNNHAHVLRVGPSITTEYLNYCLAKYPFTPLTTGTTGRKKLTKAALSAALIAIPPLNEQVVISERLALAESSGELMQEAVIEADIAAATLRQSILAAAFRGELA